MSNSNRVALAAIALIALAPHSAIGQEKAAPAKPGWDVATDFLKLAVAGKTADAVKLCVPGTISENKIGEIKKWVFTGTKTVAILINDRRIDVVYEASRDDRGNAGHLVLMLDKSKGGAWLVKDIDFDDADKVKTRVELYLKGRYDLKPEKK